MQALDRLLARLFHPTKVWVRVVGDRGAVRLVGPMGHFTAEMFIAAVGGEAYRFPGRGAQRVVSMTIVPVKS